MHVYLASANAGKLEEIGAIFAGTALDVARYDGYRAVAEDAPDYLGNALLKARALATRLRVAGIGSGALADDSGLEVDALGGGPGVYSARYGGERIGWPRRRELLLEALRDVPADRRGAHFVCTLVLLPPNGEALTAIGRVTGSIVEAPRGDGGFGYDPLFYVASLGCTFAELTAATKNTVSHRAAAAGGLLKTLGERGLV